MVSSQVLAPKQQDLNVPKNMNQSMEAPFAHHTYPGTSETHVDVR